MKNFLQRAGAARRSLAILLLFLYPITVFAHKRGGEAIGFASGFLHPISGLDHILAMVAVGMWGAQLGAPAIWVLPGYTVGSLGAFWTIQRAAMLLGIIP